MIPVGIGLAAVAAAGVTAYVVKKNLDKDKRSNLSRLWYDMDLWKLNQNKRKISKFGNEFRKLKIENEKKYS